ncbi:DNA polymerase III subunit beta [Mesorhizobium sp. BR-1-1-8]|uniref:DNA polymerase III subunit beta n=1 Tax=unclassified Mesorhizobium TaxID=325217 RepID=UPI001CCCA709|nr:MULTISPECIES: DNA polymerase III subunit beta [unclassified Mesorhizobium]MBZ9973478.1 DNA polymerase III subunit beta [Mesorhizobium sp. BR1-1-12]MBZ9984966.1 DNA polymerase III subunit beta [Mesorhizobium sp. BR-1-1-8]
MRTSRHEFARLLTAVAKAVPTRNTIPILTCVKLIAASGKLTATTTDLDVEITGSIEAEGDFASCIDAKLLAGIVAKVTGDTIELETDDKGATLKAGRSKFKLETLPVEDFPTLDHGKFTAEFEADLHALFASVAFAMSQEATRHYLCGIYLQPDAVTATDGHRLATRKVDAVGKFKPVIVPRYLVPLLPAGKTTVRLSSGKIQIASDTSVITSRLVEGTFPDYERVIPSGNDKIAVVDADALRQAAGRVALISNERGKGVRLVVSKDGIGLWARGSGEAEDLVDAEYEGDQVEVGMNAQYLADILTAMPDGAANVAIADGGSPVLFTSPSDASLRIVGMPMRVG